ALALGLGRGQVARAFFLPRDLVAGARMFFRLILGRGVVRRGHGLGFRQRFARLTGRFGRGTRRDRKQARGGDGRWRRKKVRVFHVGEEHGGRLITVFRPFGHHFPKNLDGGGRDGGVQ